MAISKVEFTELEKEMCGSGKSFSEHLASEFGRVYVIAITREECPACASQKPKLEKLARALIAEYRDRVVFIQIHVRRPPGSEEESLRSKTMLGHYSYPTNLILLRTRDRGVMEYYRSIAPRMTELERNIKNAVKTAAMFAENALRK